MKKLILFIYLIAFATYAQIADGSNAPDFTATDLNGNTHTLSDYLAEGKTVFIDFSATWCSACWRAHKSPAFKDLYYSYGPDGSDEVMVFFIEPDPNTSIEDLYGTGSNTIGNWVEGTPFPIIDSSEIGNLYQISGYPTFIRICPDGSGGGTVYKTSFSDVHELISDIKLCNETILGVPNHIGVIDTQLASCSSSVSPEVEIKNYGTNEITSAEVSLLKDGVQIASTNYLGNIGSYSNDYVSFSEIDFDTNAIYTAKVTKVNGVNPFNEDFAIGAVDLDISNIESGTLDVEVIITTDVLGEETKWYLSNSNGTEVASGGPYPNTPTTHPAVNVTLEEGECYTLTVTDSVGNGMNSGFGEGSFEVKNAHGQTLVSGGKFGSIIRKSIFATSTLSITDENKNINLRVYPNPAKEHVNISFENQNSDYTLTLLDISGRVIPIKLNPSKNGNLIDIKIDVSSVQKGVYFLKYSSNNSDELKKIIIN